MKVSVLETRGSQAQGAALFESPLSVDHLLFFPNIPVPGIVHMRNVHEPLRVYFLDDKLNSISNMLLAPGEKGMIPPETRHMVETSSYALALNNFGFLEAYL